MLVHSLPSDKDALNPSVDIVATFDATTGEYVFDSTERIKILDLNTEYYFLIESITVGSNVTESDFVVGRNTPITLEFFNERIKNERSTFAPFPFNINSVVIPIDTNVEFKTTNAKDSLLIKPSGRIQQQPSMIDLEEIVLTVQLQMYRTNDQPFMKRFTEGLK